MFSKKIVILIVILFSVLAVFAVVFLNDEYSASARRAAFEADRTRYMSDILRITNGVMPVLWIEPKYSYESNAKYFNLSGNGNHATQGTEANQPAVSPPGLKFDGVDDYLDTANNIGISGAVPRTMSLWMKAGDKDGTTYGQGLVGFGDCSVPNAFLLIYDSSGYSSDGGIRLEGYGANLNGSPNTITRGRWHHIVGKYDGTTSYIYIDGVLDTYGNFSLNTTDSTVRIGHDMACDSLGTPFQGSTDSVRIYNIALTAAQIQNLYLAGLPGHR